jgi:four helix bundle suffix protein
LIPPHGGYRELKSYQNAEIVYDATVRFCDRFVDRRSRTHDQMVQAARSGKQNIAEGSMASGTSKKTELKLVNVARASLEELLLDYEDFLRQRKLGLWGKDHPTAQAVRKLINQTNYLLDQQLRQLEQQFLHEGGFTEKLYRTRIQARKNRG